MYSLPSASQRCEPDPRTMKGGSPSTARKARTGELTPPGMTRSARCCSLRDCSTFLLIATSVATRSDREINKYTSDNGAGLRRASLVAVMKHGPENSIRSNLPNLQKINPRATLLKHLRARFGASDVPFWPGGFPGRLRGAP